MYTKFSILPCADVVPSAQGFRRHLFIYCLIWAPNAGRRRYPPPSCSTRSRNRRQSWCSGRAKRHGRAREARGGGGPSARPPLSAVPGVSMMPGAETCPCPSPSPSWAAAPGPSSPERQAVGGWCLSSASQVRGWSPGRAQGNTGRSTASRCRRGRSRGLRGPRAWVLASPGRGLRGETTPAEGRLAAGEERRAAGSCRTRAGVPPRVSAVGNTSNKCAIACATGECAWALTCSRGAQVPGSSLFTQGTHGRGTCKWARSRAVSLEGLGSDPARVWGAAARLGDLPGRAARGGRAPGPAARLSAAELPAPASPLCLSGRPPGTVSHIHSPFLLDLCRRVERPSLTSFS